MICNGFLGNPINCIVRIHKIPIHPLTIDHLRAKDWSGAKLEQLPIISCLGLYCYIVGQEYQALHG